MKVIRPAVVGVLVVLAAACNGETSEPSTLPDLTPTVADTSPTPAPTPTVDPPVEPPNAHDYSEEGVEAFTRYAIDVINYAYQTNDVTYLEQIMTSDCVFCASTVHQVVTIEAASGQIEGGQLLPQSVSVVGPADGVQTSAGVNLTVTASTTTDGDGEVRNTEPDRDMYFIFNLERENGTWLLAEVLSTGE